MDAQALKEALLAAPFEEALRAIGDTLKSRPNIATSVVGFACPDLTYAPARGIKEQRAVGTLKSFSAKSGFGFIACEELLQVFGTDIFVHKKQMGPYFTFLTPGTPVTFAVVLGKEKPQAYDIQPLDGLVEAAQNAKAATLNTGIRCAHVAPHFGAHRKWQESGAELGRFKGLIKKISSEDGFGFIVSEELAMNGYPNDVFLLAKHAQGLQAGQVVSFTAFLNDKGHPQAKNVELQ